MSSPRDSHLANTWPLIQSLMCIRLMSHAVELCRLEFSGARRTHLLYVSIALSARMHETPLPYPSTAHDIPMRMYSLDFHVLVHSPACTAKCPFQQVIPKSLCTSRHGYALQNRLNTSPASSPITSTHEIRESRASPCAMAWMLPVWLVAKLSSTASPSRCPSCQPDARNAEFAYKNQLYFSGQSCVH